MMTLTKLSETQTKITLGWAPVPSAIGYRFQSATQAPKWSHSWDPYKTQVTFSKASWYKVEALGVENSGQYPQAQPQPGIAIDSFADVVDARGWGKYVNRWDRTNQNDFHGDEVTGPPWLSINGPSIDELSGGGFRFRCNSEMLAFSSGSKAIMLHDQDHYIPPTLNPPYEFDWSAEYVFPQAGNPDGWAPYYDFNALLEFVGDSFVANQLGVDGPRNCLYMRTYNAPNNWTRVHRATTHPIQWDTPMRVRCHWRFSYGADGFARFYVNDNQIGEFTGQTIESGKRYQSFMFGYYSSASIARNEILMRDLRVQVKH